MSGLWDYYRKTEEERVKAHNEYHLRRIGECLTTLRGHYYKIPVKYEKRGIEMKVFDKEEKKVRKVFRVDFNEDETVKHVYYWDEHPMYPHRNVDLITSYLGDKRWFLIKKEHDAYDITVRMWSFSKKDLEDCLDDSLVVVDEEGLFKRLTELV